jgi:hypothetical protein
MYNTVLTISNMYVKFCGTHLNDTIFIDSSGNTSSANLTNLKIIREAESSSSSSDQSRGGREGRGRGGEGRGEGGGRGGGGGGGGGGGFGRGNVDNVIKTGVEEKKKKILFC